MDKKEILRELATLADYELKRENIELERTPYFTYCIRDSGGFVKRQVVGPADMTDEEAKNEVMSWGESNRAYKEKRRQELRDKLKQ